MGHELTRNFEFDGKEFVFASVDPKTGKKLSDEEIVRRFRTGQLKPLGVFNSRAEANAFADKRSQSFGNNKTILQRLLEGSDRNL